MKRAYWWKHNRSLVFTIFTLVPLFGNYKNCYNLTAVWLYIFSNFIYWDLQQSAYFCDHILECQYITHDDEVCKAIRCEQSECFRNHFLLCFKFKASEVHKFGLLIHAAEFLCVSIVQWNPPKVSHTHCNDIKRLSRSEPLHPSSFPQWVFIFHPTVDTLCDPPACLQVQSNPMGLDRHLPEYFLNAVCPTLVK